MKNSQSSLLILTWIFIKLAVSLIITGLVLGEYNLLIFILGLFVGFIVMAIIKVGSRDE